MADERRMEDEKGEKDGKEDEKNTARKLKFRIKATLDEIVITSDKNGSYDVI